MFDGSIFGFPPAKNTAILPVFGFVSRTYQKKGGKLISRRLFFDLAHRFPEQVPEKTLSFYLRFPKFNTAIKTRFWKNRQKYPKMIFLNSFAGPFPEQDPVKTPSLYLRFPIVFRRLTIGRFPTS